MSAVERAGHHLAADLPLPRRQPVRREQHPDELVAADRLDDHRDVVVGLADQGAGGERRPLPSGVPDPGPEAARGGRPGAARHHLHHHREPAGRDVVQPVPPLLRRRCGRPQFAPPLPTTTTAGRPPAGRPCASAAPRAGSPWPARGRPPPGIGLPFGEVGAGPDHTRRTPAGPSARNISRSSWSSRAVATRFSRVLRLRSSADMSDSSATVERASGQRGEACAAGPGSTPPRPAGARTPAGSGSRRWSSC